MPPCEDDAETCPHLVERHEQLSTLTELFTTCSRTGGLLAALTGPVGTGKSALLNRFRSQVTESGHQYLDADGANGGRGVSARIADQLDCDPATPSREIGRRLCALATRTPVVVGIDNLDQANVSTLRFVTSLIIRTHSVRVLTVITVNNSLHRARPAIQEIRTNPRTRTIGLAPLSTAGVAELLAARFGNMAAERLAGEWHAVSGGNPRLVHALVHDFLMRNRPAHEPTPGDAYRAAVLDCLRALGQAVAQVARAIAVLGSANTTSIGAFTRHEPRRVRRALDTLTSSGLLAGDGFPHPAIRDAVLSGLSTASRANLHVQAATLLHNSGSPADEVARHLVTAGRVPSQDMVHTLVAAAAKAHADNELGHAVSCLRLADGACTDQRQRAKVGARLLDAEWHFQRPAAVRRLSTLTTNVRTFDQHTVALTERLLWTGRTQEAATLLALAGHPTGHGTRTRLHKISLLQSAHHLPPLNTNLPTLDRPGGVSTAAATTLHALSVHNDGVTRAMEVLERSRLEDDTLESAVLALRALVVTDHLDDVPAWCEILASEARARQNTTTIAAVAAVRQHLAFRRGDLRTTESLTARAAGTAPETWGVDIGAPLATHLLALTAMGRHAETARLLRQPVPKAMFRTTFGLQYLRARGRHYLATGCPRAALLDFYRCGQEMNRWHLKLAAFIPWRTDAAEAHIRMNNYRLATKFAQEQLNELTDTHTHARAVALRVLAATADLDHRPTLLRKAIDLAETTGDQLELARTTADLATTQLLRDELPQSAATATLTRNLAESCGADVRGLPTTTPTTPAVLDRLPPASTTTRTATLTIAERQVATLAVRGNTNRDIARKLHITVSTVEQHLTRAYRKLNVTSRRDLPPQIGLVAQPLIH